MSDRKSGVLQSWHSEKGLWGIVAVNWNEQYFLYVSGVTSAPDSGPIVGMTVEFDVAPPYKNGRLNNAVNAVLEEVQ